MKRVYVVTRPENFAIIRQSGQIPAASLAEAWQMAQAELAELDHPYTYTIMSHASGTLPVLQQ
jgi:hypothetical protein